MAVDAASSLPSARAHASFRRLTHIFTIQGARGGDPPRPPEAFPRPSPPISFYLSAFQLPPSFHLATRPCRALPRWLRAFFSSGVSSAAVLPAAGSKKSGS